jgi:bifunctional non-homologous end joining protein LigD
VLVRLGHDPERDRRADRLLIKRHGGLEREGGDEILLDQDHSVPSGRTMEEIATGKGRNPKPFMLGNENRFKANAIWRSNRGNGARKLAPLAPAPKSKPVPRAQESGNHAAFHTPQLCKRVVRSPDQARPLSYAAARRKRRSQKLTRKGSDWTDKFAAIGQAARDLPDSIIDGEVVALNHDGVPVFATLQAALSGRALGGSELFRVRSAVRCE